MALTPLLRDLALLPLPAAGSLALSRSSEEAVRAVLAASPHAPSGVVDALATDRSARVRRNALRRTKDVSLLTRQAARGVLDAAAVAANPLTPTDLLAELTTSSSHVVARAALSNRSTPCEAVTAAVAGRPASEVAVPHSATNNSIRSSRAATVLAAHPHVALAWGGDPDSAVRRAVGRMLSPPPEAVASLLASGRAGLSALSANPTVPASLLPRPTPDRAALDDLLGGADPASFLATSAANRRAAARLGSPTLDLLLCASLVLEPEAALLVLSRRSPHPEADVVALLADRFGPDLGSGLRDLLAGTRLSAAAELSPLLYSVLCVPPTLAGSGWAELSTLLASHLGEDAGRWEVLTTLARDWVGSPSELAEAVGVL